MTDASNAKSEALELHELSTEELDAVSGGADNQNAQAAAQQEAENKAEMQATMTFQQLLQRC